MGRIESQDFLNWSKPQLVLAPNDLDPPQLEFHTSPVFLYNRQYFSLNQILNRSAGIMDIELMTSRDGLRWNRPYRGISFLNRGEPGSFDAATLLTNGNPVLVGDEMRFYYGAYRGTAIGAVGLDRQIIGGKDYYSGVGLAKMPRDRFVAIAPDPRVGLRNSLKVSRETVGQEVPPVPKPNTIGQVTLRPLDLSGVARISINTDASHGSLRGRNSQRRWISCPWLFKRRGDSDSFRFSERGCSMVIAFPFPTPSRTLPAASSPRQRQALRMYAPSLPSR